jgi:hypothetical protein
VPITTSRGSTRGVSQGGTERSNLLSGRNLGIYPIPGGRFIRFSPFLRCGTLFTMFCKSVRYKGIRNTPDWDATNPPSPLFITYQLTHNQR